MRRRLRVANPTIRRETSSLRFLGLLVTCVGFSTFAAAAHTVEVTSGSVVSAHWRGAYDLLVRPVSSQTDVERTTGIVEGNYLGTPAGGITQSQYELIKAIPDVEVAAPVATVGFLLNSTGAIDVELQGAEAGRIYRSQLSLTSLDESPSRQFSSTSYFGLSPILEEGRNLIASGVRDAVVGPEGLVAVGVGELPVLWTLVAGIDPVQEAALIQLDQSVEGDYLPASAPLTKTIDEVFGREAARIPILVNKHSFLRYSVSMTLDSVPLADASIWEQLVDGTTSVEGGDTTDILANLFASATPSTEVDQTVSLEDILQPMAAQTLTFRPGKEPDASPSGFFTRTATNVTLYPGAVPYEADSPPAGSGQLTLAIRQQGSWGSDVAPQILALVPPSWRLSAIDVPDEAPLFRALFAYEPPPFVFDVRGTYDIAHPATMQDPLSYVPLGIYEPPIATLLYDGNGNPVVPEPLTSGLNPGSFIPRPPLALTTLQGAAYLRNREDFIDAIRVRVGGIEGYSSESVAKIERLASEITERTGLHVDIVAGSSPQGVLVRVPGLGYVEELWTTLGASEGVTKGINAANLVLLACLLVASGLFVSNGAQLSILRSREEIGILKALGWLTRDVSRLLMRDALELSFFGAALTAIASVALTLALGLRPSFPVVVAASLGIPCLYLVSSFIPAQSAAARSPADLLRHGEWISPARERLFPVPLNLAGLAVRQVYRRRAQAALLVGITSAGVGLAVILADVVKQLQGSLVATLLGEFVALSVRPYHHLMIITALAMGGLAILESLLVSVSERTREFAILSAVGWKMVHVLVTVLLEGAFIGALGGLGGGVAGTLLFWLISGVSGPAVWMVLLLGFTSGVLLGAAAGVYPAWQAHRVRPSLVLSAPAERHASPWLSQGRTPTRTSFALMVVIAILGVALLGGRTDVMRQALNLGLLAGPTPHPATLLVSGENALRHARFLASLGPRANANSAEAQALQYVSDVLTSYGWQVSLQPVPLTTVSFFDGKGDSVELPGAVAEPSGISVRFDEARVGSSYSGPALLLGPEPSWPSSEAVRGKIVFLGEASGASDKSPLQDLVDHYGLPAPYTAAVAVTALDVSALESFFRHEGLTATIPVSGNLIAVLPSENTPSREVWITAPYDSNRASPGADLDASGVGVIIEIARVLAQRGSALPLRLILTTGTDTGLEGAIEYISAHSDNREGVKAVVEFEQVGAWTSLMVGQDLEALTSDGTPLDPATYNLARAEGQSFLRGNWVQRLDLSNPNLLEWLAQRTPRNGGMTESPQDLVGLALNTASLMGIQARPAAYPCPGSYLAFLYGDLPTVVVCGEGNGLAGSRLDTPDTLRLEKLAQVAAMGYQIIQQLASEEDHG